MVSFACFLCGGSSSGEHLPTCPLHPDNCQNHMAQRIAALEAERDAVWDELYQTKFELGQEQGVNVRLRAELAEAVEASRTYRTLSSEAYALLDNDYDMKCLKLLKAMAGWVGYRPETDRLAAFLAKHKEASDDQD